MKMIQKFGFIDLVQISPFEIQIKEHYSTYKYSFGGPVSYLGPINISASLFTI